MQSSAFPGGRPTEGKVLAVDVGGTKLAAGLVDAAAGLSSSSSVPTPPSTGPQDAEVVWEALEGLVRRVGAAGEATAVGVGCGGPMRRGGSTVSPLNIAAWREFPLKSRLEELTGLPVAVDNDAKALARGEGWAGAAAGEPAFLAMVVSTGVGGGLVVDGRLLDGATGNAGHIGHVVVNPGGRRCRCGARGCLEAEASGTAIAAMTGRPAAEAGPDVVERTGRMVGRAVGSVANLLDLGLVVVAGSVALGFGEPFFAAASAEMDRTAQLDFSRGSRIVASPLGAEGPLVGAGAVGWWGAGSP